MYIQYACLFIQSAPSLVCMQEAAAKVDTFSANANKLRDLTGRATRTLQQTIAAIEAELEVVSHALRSLLLVSLCVTVEVGTVDTLHVTFSSTPSFRGMTPARCPQWSSLRRTCSTW